MIIYKGTARSGFHRIEFVIVVGIGITLLGLIITWPQRVREGVFLTQTQNNLKQLSLANHSCNDVHKRLPPAFDKFGDMPFPASVHVHLLPYIEEDKLYKKYLAEGGQGEVTEQIVQPFIRVQDPSLDDKAGIQNQAANLRIYADKGSETRWDADMPALGAIEPGNPGIPRTFVDGTSNTIIFATKLAVCGDGGSRYAAAPDSPFAAYFGQNAAQVKAHRSAKNATFQLNGCQCLTTPLMAQSFSENGLSVAMADGSVCMVNPDISPRTWNLLVQPNDGMELGDDW